MPTPKIDLSKAAYQLADEIREGHWDHIKGIKTKPVPECQEIIIELGQRCPGYSLEEYKRAIATGLFESR